MSLTDTLRSELLEIRKKPGGLTPAGMANFVVLRSVLGAGDPVAAFNALRHSVLSFEGDLSVMAAAYSLGFASAGYTHLDRLTDFGRDYGYDQRQARRHSDKGIRELAVFVAEQWSLDAAPSIRLTILRGESDEIVCSTTTFYFVEMREPVIELVSSDGGRRRLSGGWQSREDDLLRHGFAHFALGDTEEWNQAVSILWRGELWPHFDIHIDRSLSGGARVQLFGARAQLTLARSTDL